MKNLFFFVMICTAGCSCKEPIIREESVVEIQVLHGQEFELENRITDSRRIEEILNAINTSSEITVKFYPLQKLNIMYADGKEELLLINGEYLKHESKTYLLPRDIKNILIL